jgi:hypothetical protein
VHVLEEVKVIKLGLKLVSLEENFSCTPKKPSMEGYNKYDETIYPFKILLEESLKQQRNEMMVNFVQILCQLPTRNTSTSSGGTVPFKVYIRGRLFVSKRK